MKKNYIIIKKPVVLSDNAEYSSVEFDQEVFEKENELELGKGPVALSYEDGKLILVFEGYKKPRKGKVVISRLQ